VVFVADLPPRHAAHLHAGGRMPAQDARFTATPPVRLLLVDTA